MSSKVLTGLDRLTTQAALQNSVQGKVALLAHSASINGQFEWGVVLLKKIFGKRLVKLFGPQHGMFATVQDNMVETSDFHHPYLDLDVISLYSTARSPSLEQLQDFDTLIVDLQDVGTRIYTYIYTLTLFMEAIHVHKLPIKILILDRPNPIDGVTVEGNLLDLKFASFVGRHRLPVRHGLTMGEVGLWAKKYLRLDIDVEVLKMENYQRRFSFFETKLPWVNPSPNLPTIESAYTFPTTVLFEGTNISEGRGTTRSLELFGHPSLEPFSFLESLNPVLKEFQLSDFTLRPIYFQPTFQKHAGANCGGLHIHPLDLRRFRPWKLGQVLLRELKFHLKSSFAWKSPPYEYDFTNLPIDLINGTDQLRLWVEKRGSLEELETLENKGREEFLQQKATIEIYA